MTKEEVLLEVATLARQQFGFQGELRPEMRLAEDLGLDSLRLLTLAVEVENRFEVCLSEEAEAEIVTVGDLASVVLSQRENSGAPRPDGGGSGIEG